MHCKKFELLVGHWDCASIAKTLRPPGGVQSDLVGNHDVAELLERKSPDIQRTNPASVPSVEGRKEVANPRTRRQRTIDAKKTAGENEMFAKEVEQDVTPVGVF